MITEITKPQFRDNPEQAAASYWRNGYHIEYDVWTAAECDRITELAYGCPDRAIGDYSPLMQPHRKIRELLSYLRKVEIVDTIELLLKGEASGLQSEYYFGAPGIKGFARHQDNFYLEAQMGAFVSTWSALTDVSPENGGLFLFPGTHREPILPTAKLTGGSGDNQDPNSNNEEAVVPPQYDAVDATLPKGAVIYLHGNVVHGSHANTSDRFRSAILFTYIRHGVAYRSGRYAKRTEIPLHV